MRVWLGGEGNPIPEIALPDIHAGDAVPIILLMDDQEVFRPTDYASLGYNYFQAWCVGGSGGKGADSVDSYAWVDLAYYQREMTDAEWAAYVAQFTLPYYRVLDPTRFDPVTHSYIPNPDGSEPWIYITGAQYAQRENPYHFTTVRPHDYLHLVSDNIGGIVGGGGGGGGLQVVTGHLSDLPEEVLCTVGDGGADPERGYDRLGEAFDPVPESIHGVGTYVDSYPTLHPLLLPPQRGGDGGASSFGGVCKASGGKGGYPTTYFDDPADPTKRFYDGRGADGGIGGRLEAGGGASGAFDPDRADGGRNGSWDPNTGIGSGGGGGRGGFVLYPLPPMPAPIHLGTGA